MLIGKTNSEKYEQREKDFHESLAQMIPVRVFTFLPKQLVDGRYVWFEYVWKVAWNFNRIRNNRDIETTYFIDKEAAYNYSREMNEDFCRENEVIEYAKKHLYK